MDSNDHDPDMLRLKSSVKFPSRAERYDIKEVDMQSPSPPRQSFMQMFDFSAVLKQHPHKYKTMMKEDVAEEAAADDAVDSKSKLELKLAERTKSHDGTVGKKLSQQRMKSAEKIVDRVPEGVQPKRSSSCANIHDMKKSIPEDEEESYFRSLSKELALGLDDYIYNHALPDSEDDSVVPPVPSPSAGQAQEGSLIRTHSLASFASFEKEAQMRSVKLPDGSEVKLPDVETMSQSSSANVTPVNTPKSSPRLRPKHELISEHMGCVPVELQPDRKKLFGIGPSYQPPSDQVCVHRVEAKQLNLLQRVVKEGFSASARTTFHQREDTDFFPPDQPQTQASIDSAKDLKSRFMTSAEMNFLSPSSM